MLFYGSFWSSDPGQPGHFTIENYATVLTTSWYIPTILNTVSVGVATALLATALGVPMAWIVSRTNVPMRRLWDYIGVAPVFIPPLLGAVAWIILASPRIGLINRLIIEIIPFVSGPVFDIYSFWGIVWVMGLFYSPYIFLFVSGALKSLDPSLEETSRVCGASTIRTILRIELPLIAPALLSGVMLVLVLSMNQFSAPLLLGWSEGFYTLTTRIYRLVALPPINYGLATALCVVLQVIAVSLIGAQRKFLGSRKFVTVTGRGFRPRLTDIGKWKYGAFVFCMFYIFVAAVLPLSVLLITSFNKVTGYFLQLTLENYEFLFGFSLFWRSIKNSLFVAIVGATVCMVMCIVASWIIHRTKVAGRGILEYIVMFSVAVPGIVMAMGILWAWITIPIGIYGTIWILMFACIARFITYGVRSTSSTLVQIDKELEESSRICGASWLRTMSEITIPLLKPGIASGWILLFIVFFRELTMVLLLWVSSTMTMSVLAIEFWSEASYPVYSALGIIQTAIIFGVVALFKKFLGGEVQLV